MKKILLLLYCCLLALAACAAPLVEPAPPPVEPEPPQTTASYDMMINTQGIEVWAEWPNGRPRGTVMIYETRPLRQIAEQYLDSYAQAWLAASAAHPDDGYAITECKLAAPPVVTYLSPADSEPFIFTCYVEQAFKPLNYQQYTCTGGTHPDDEEGWLVTPFFWRFAVDADGRVTNLPGSTDGVYLFEGEIPIGFIREAQQVYDWFELDSSSLIDQDLAWERVEYQDNLYCPSRFATYAELEDYLRQYFSAEITATLLGSQILAEIEGRLYVINAARGAHLAYEGERWYLTEAGPDKFAYTVAVDYLFPEEPEQNRWTETFQFVLETGGEHGWEFSRFASYL